jgi:hypothetical protein
LVKVDEYLPLGDLCNVVHALTCIVSNTSILVAEAGEDWGDDFFEVASDFLQHASATSSHVSKARGILVLMLSKPRLIL